MGTAGARCCDDCFRASTRWCALRGGRLLSGPGFAIVVDDISAPIASGGAGLDGPEHRGTIDPAIAPLPTVWSEQHVPPCLCRTPPSDRQGRRGPAPHPRGVDSQACLIGRGTW